MLFFVLFLVLLLSPTGCMVDESPAPRSNLGGPVVDPDAPRTLELSLEEAPCTIHVEGFGDVDIEEDYIPNVVACENGNAPMEALKAQAIQARGYIYYKIFVEGSGSVVNSTADQVYQCDYASAEERHFEAARATRAEVLTWQDQIVATFYVAGAVPADQDSGAADQACQGGGGNDPTDTEKWVTYNQGKTGCGIDMTPLGWTPEDCGDNPQNRGCASQNGQACLANRGWGYEQMMPFYYGDDIVIERAGGACGGAYEEPTAQEQYCQDNPDIGATCFDDQQLLICSGGDVDATETCPYGCEDDACIELSEHDQFCADQADDGWYCVSDALRLNCEDGQIGATESCTAGCEDDQCLASGQSEDAGGSQNDNEGDNQGSGGAGDNTPDGEPASLVVTSPGISGGCATTATGPSPPWVLMMLMLVALATTSLISSRRGGRRRRRGRARYSRGH